MAEGLVRRLNLFCIIVSILKKVSGIHLTLFISLFIHIQFKMFPFVAIGKEMRANQHLFFIQADLR